MLRIKLILTSLLVMLTASVVASTSASATPLRWLVNGEEIASGTVEKTTSKGTTTFTLKSVVLTLTAKIECSTEKDEGTIQNPTGEGNGSDTDVVHFTGCTVPEPSGLGCKVSEPITFEATTELKMFSEKLADEYKPKGTKFGEITFSGCSVTELNKSFSVKGTYDGIILNSTSEFEFIPSSSALTLGGEPATLKGKSKQELAGGGIWFAGWGSLVVETGGPFFKIKKAETRTLLIRYTGWGQAEKLSVTISNPVFVEKAGSNCAGKTLLKNDTCEMNIECNGAIGATGKIIAQSTTALVWKGEGELECI